MSYSFKSSLFDGSGTLSKVLNCLCLRLLICKVKKIVYGLTASEGEGLASNLCSSNCKVDFCSGGGQ